ncbi:DNA polymerase I OS=Streptomyces microflavus OX=1919 GN=polA PE=4 SV=1 [Streptomyces microflavus]
MTERWAVSATDGGGALLVGLERDGTPAGPVLAEPDLVEAVRSRPGVSRWVWRSTAELYPRLLAAGVRVERCYDIECAELLLLGHAGRLGEPRSAAAALARLENAPVPPDPPARSAEPGAQSSLFEPPSGPGVPFEGLLRVYADQVRRHEAAEHPDRMRLLTASESAGMLVAAEMHRSGLPWRADVHREVLHGLLGERYAGGGEPRRLAELADEVSAAFGRRVRPDLPADVVKAFAQAGIAVKSTRRWELAELDHPAVEPLIAYKKLYRIWTAHGWSWLQDWVREGRFRPEYQPGGTVSGRWTTNGGGALQIPKVIRQAVVADEGWRLVVADADQMEPRVLAAISRDRGLMEVAGHDGDLYKALSDRAFHGDREHAKLALLGAVYGQTSGDGLKNLAALRRRFPLAVAYVDDAARAGARGGRSGPGWAAPARRSRWRARTRQAGIPQEERRGQVRRRAWPGPGAASPGGSSVRRSAADWAQSGLSVLRRTARQELLEAGLPAREVLVACPAGNPPRYRRSGAPSI